MLRPRLKPRRQRPLPQAPRPSRRRVRPLSRRRALLLQVRPALLFVSFEPCGVLPLAPLPHRGRVLAGLSPRSPARLGENADAWAGGGGSDLAPASPRLAAPCLWLASRPDPFTPSYLFLVHSFTACPTRVGPIPTESRLRRCRPLSFRFAAASLCNHARSNNTFPSLPTLLADCPPASSEQWVSRVFYPAMASGGLGVRSERLPLRRMGEAWEDCCLGRPRVDQASSSKPARQG